MSIDLNAVNEFFRQEVKDLNAASRAAIRAAARKLKREMQSQVRKNFRRGTYSNGSFFNAFKIYDLDADQSRGAASYVRSGVPFLGVFEDGDVITAKNGKYLILLLPEGEKLGFKRITKGNTWDRVYNRYKKQLRIVNKGNRILVLYEYQGRLTPVYLFTTQVKVGKRISFYDAAERIANEIPDAINDLLK